jgi:hypothetical protein
MLPLGPRDLALTGEAYGSSGCFLSKHALDINLAELRGNVYNLKLVKCVPCYHGMRRHPVADEEYGLQICTVTEKYSVSGRGHSTRGGLECD